VIGSNRRKAILREVKKLLRTLFQRRHELWPVPPTDPLDLIDLQIIITKLLGVRYSEPEEIPSPAGHGRIAGSMDRKKGEIAIAQRLKPEVQRFTAAHEIGHWLLHPANEYFRDAPMDGSDRGSERPAVEREADLFAALLLMPDNLVRQNFHRHFGNETLAAASLDEHLVALISHGIEEKTPLKPSALRSTRQISKLAAQCLSLWNLGSPSLAKQFKVSPGAMAIRLEEINLVPSVQESKKLADGGLDEIDLEPSGPAPMAPLAAKPDLEVYDVFISYRREDREFVQWLITELRKRGLNPWFDGLLVAGTRWRREIDEAVQGSRVAVILLGSLGCEGYQDIEIEALVDEFLEKGSPIIPVFIPGWSDETRVPFSLKAFQRVDFREDKAEALEKLIQGILSSRTRRP